MRLGIHLPHIGQKASAEAIRRAAVQAEELGFADVWVSEHIIVPKDRAYPPSAIFWDPVLTLTWAAAYTSRVGLGTSVLVLPMRHPLPLAKELATLQNLSGGRLILGAGVGWLAEEFAALGIPFERRGARTHEYIDVMRRLWTEKTSSHAGEFLQFAGVLSYPKPVSATGIPVWFGGESNAALRRVAEYGDGWIGFKVPPAEAGAKIRRIEELLGANRRRRSDVTLAVSPYTDPITPDDLARYRDAGVEEVALLLRGRPRNEAEIIAGLEQMARDFVEPAARL